MNMKTFFIGILIVGVLVSFASATLIIKEEISFSSGNDLFEITKSVLIGNQTNNVLLTSNGITLNGTARVREHIQFYPYDIGGIAGTYNGITNEAPGLTAINGVYLRSFNSGQGSGKAEAINIMIHLPDNYVAGTDLNIVFSWTTAATTGKTRWQAGLTDISIGETYSPSTYAWATPVNVPVDGTAWGRVEQTFVLSGTNLLPGDDVNLIVFRDADNAEDTSTGDSYIVLFKANYLVNSFGVAA